MFQHMTQFGLLLSCDSDLKSDWVFQLSGSGSNSLNSRKLPGRFSLPKRPGNEAISSQEYAPIDGAPQEGSEGGREHTCTSRDSSRAAIRSSVSICFFSSAVSRFFCSTACHSMYSWACGLPQKHVMNRSCSWSNP